MPQLTDKLLDLKCINHNMYIGSGHDKCDDCVDFETALSELENFIAKELAQAREDESEKIMNSLYGTGDSESKKRLLYYLKKNGRQKDNTLQDKLNERNV